MARRIIVTSALPYVNNIPHLGTLVCVISADVYTRYLRLRDRNVISVLGTDEHGTTAETKALEEGVTPRQLVDRFFAIHKDIYEWFNCEFDCLGRTTSPNNHKISQDIFLRLYRNGYISEKEEEHPYCEHCKRFLADRFVAGTCPFCGFQDARGDQCDSCGKLLNPSELASSRCKVCGASPVTRKSRHLFIDLPKIEPKLREWMKGVEGSWSQNARSMTQAWLREGLRPRAITRDLKWGIAVPLPGYEDKVFYSWFDAPIGYISITADNRADWAEWWKDPETRLVQFMGKDNIPFHTILFPAFCIGADDNYTLVRELSVNEYLNYEGGKFSKSRNIGIFGDDAHGIGIPADVWRYYLMINRPEKADTEFSWEDFQEKLNNELVANLGNLVNRTMTFLDRYFKGTVPAAIPDPRLTGPVKGHIEKIDRLYSEIRLKDALREVMALSKFGNQYFQEQEPWKSVRTEPRLAAETIANLASLIKDLGIVIQPFLPATAAKIHEQLGVKGLKWSDLGRPIKDGQKTAKPRLLFAKLDSVAELKQRFSGRKHEFMLDLRVGLITEASEHPKADKLMVLQVDLGTEQRQIVSGVREHYKKKDLVGRKILVVTNLMMSTLRGIESNGMLLAADVAGEPKIIFVEGRPGEQVQLMHRPVTESVLTFADFNKHNKLSVVNGMLAYEGVGLAVDGSAIAVDAPDKSQVR